jgi:hypothetical protein
MYFVSEYSVCRSFVFVIFSLIDYNSLYILQISSLLNICTTMISHFVVWLFSFKLFFWLGWGMELGRDWGLNLASLWQSKCSTVSATPPDHFSLVILEIGSLELFFPG